MQAHYRFSEWILDNWSRGGLLTAAVLLTLAPAVYESAGFQVLSIYLWLPLYMIHQYEEHGQGTFLAFYRKMMPTIAPYLTDRKLLVVNLGTVWVLFLGSFYAALHGHYWLALYAPYLALINAFMHVGQLIAWRSYNPGLWTALVLFFPGAACTILILSGAGTTFSDNLWGFAFGLLAHVFFFALGRGWIAKSL